ncbi:hypothetical protein NIES2130_04965 [Scytonema sp. HK-05]|nr:hypothetical protein NIES2130_04965 [Scytonema sp. HK-05]
MQSTNTIRKVSTTLGLDLSGVSRGALTRLTRIFIWVTAKKKRSTKVLLPSRYKITDVVSSPLLPCSPTPLLPKR